MIYVVFLFFQKGPSKIKSVGNLDFNFNLKKGFQIFRPVTLKRGLLKFETLGRFIKNKKCIYIHYITIIYYSLQR